MSKITEELEKKYDRDAIIGSECLFEDLEMNAQNKPSVAPHLQGILNNFLQEQFIDCHAQSSMDREEEYNIADDRQKHNVQESIDCDANERMKQNIDCAIEYLAHKRKEY